MALYAATAVTTITTATANTPIAAFRASTTQRAEIRRIRIYQRTAGTSPNEVLMVPSNALGVTPAGTVTGHAYDSNAAATTGQLETSWGTAPTITAANAIEGLMGDATVGNAWFFEYDLVRSIFVPLGNTATGSLVFFNPNATALATYRIVIAWEE